jgi:hypothetical protein
MKTIFSTSILSTESICSFLNAPVLIRPLVVFRILFGCLISYSAFRFLYYDWVSSIYVNPPFHFSYYGFSWIPFPDEFILKSLFWLQGICGFFIALGFLFRLSTCVTFVAFTWVELLEKSAYLNHYYFVSLMLFLFIFSPANRYFSLDVRVFKKKEQKCVPNYFIFSLQLQVALVYIFAGLAKVENDWVLRGEPLHTWLQAYRDLPIIGSLFIQKWVAIGFSWFALIYDLTIPFFLWHQKTKKIAFFFVVFFHVFTWFLFPIGVFPWVMIASSSLFLYTSNLQNSTYYFSNKYKSYYAALLLVFFSFQFLFPWRYLLYSGDLFRTEEGYRFSWRVMLMEKKGAATFYIEDSNMKNRSNPRSIEIVNQDFLTPQQEDQMARQPDMIVQFAHFLFQKFKDTTLYFGDQRCVLRNPKVCADVFITVNGRPHEKLIDRKVNLAQIPYDLSPKTWIEEYRKKL